MIDYDEDSSDEEDGCWRCLDFHSGSGAFVRANLLTDLKTIVERVKRTLGLYYVATLCHSGGFLECDLTISRHF